MEIEPNKNYLLYYTKYHNYIETNINNDINDEAMELNEDENNNNNIINGRWSQKEHLSFIKGCLLYGNNWKEIQTYIQTRSCSQIRSHSQKYFNKLDRKYENKNINKKLNQEEINKLVNKNKLSNKDVEMIEMHILSLFKGNKEKPKEIIKENNNELKNENDYNPEKNKKMNSPKKEKIFNITKIPKGQKIKKNILLKERVESNNENEKENEDINNISEDEYDEDNYCEKKIFKKDILAGKEDTEIISQKEEFINKCLDSKDPKDLVKLLTYFGNDVNFQVNDINILKKYQCYLGLDLDNDNDNDEENNDETSKNKNEESNSNNNFNNINNTGNVFYPYLITPSGTGIQFNPLYNPKIVLNPQIISQS